MELQLNAVEQRVLGCLMEKEMATPEYYPLTLNALVNACNQKNNRSPVMALSSETAAQTLYELRAEHKLAVEVSSSGSRVLKYRHCIADHWNFTPAETALLCELLVRGPQTPGDLRAHASRLHPLADSAEVEELLSRLADREDGPFVVQLEKEPGKRERRWAHLLAEPPAPSEIPADPPAAQSAIPAREDRIQMLENEISGLRRELAEMKEVLQGLMSAFD